MLKNQYGLFMQSHELLPVLGFKPGCHLPASGFDPVEVQGVIFKCEPVKAPRYLANGRRVNVSKARIFYLCQDCCIWIPFGRASQHNKGRDHKRRAAYREQHNIPAPTLEYGDQQT